MSAAEQMMEFKSLGIDIKKNNFSQCIDELIERYKTLIKERQLTEIDSFKQYIKSFQN